MREPHTNAEFINATWPTGFAIWRVMAIIDSNLSSDRNPLHPNFVMTTSSPCCCTPTAEFVLAEHGLEDPKAELLPTQLIKSDAPRTINGHYLIETYFQWDGSIYRGYLVPCSHSWLEGQPISAKIIDVSFVR